MLGPSDPGTAAGRLCQLHEDRHPSVFSASGRAQLRRCRLKSLAEPRCVRLLGGLAVPPAGPPAIVGGGVCGVLGAAVGEVVQESIDNG